MFRFADHIGAIVHNIDGHTLHGVSWGSRRFHRWTLGSAGRVTNANADPEKLRTLNSSDLSSEMENALDIVAHSIVIGVGATAVMDLWAAFLRRGFRVASLDYALLGRWIGHFPRGRRHESIGQAAPVRYERIIGWAAHYTIGVVFAALLLAIWGSEWLERPTLVPPLIVSSVTLVAPFFLCSRRWAPASRHQERRVRTSPDCAAPSRIPFMVSGCTRPHGCGSF